MKNHVIVINTILQTMASTEREGKEVGRKIKHNIIPMSVQTEPSLFVYTT